MSAGWKSLFPWWGRFGGVAPPAPTTSAVTEQIVDDSLWQVIAGSDAMGWRDFTALLTGPPVVSMVRPGGLGSASFTVPMDGGGFGYNELRPDCEVRIRYAGVPVGSGFVLPRAESYVGGSDHHSLVPVEIEVAGTVERAKRSDDYCHVFSDFDLGQWYTAELDGMTPGIQLDRQGHLKFGCAAGSVMASGSFQTLWYHLHGGLSTEQDIYAVGITFVSSGTMTWTAYETDLPIAGCTWTALGSDGGSTHATPVNAVFTLSAGKRALALKVEYVSGKTLSADEFVRFTEVRVYGQSGDSTIGAALTSILVGTGLADSYYSGSVS